MAVQAIDHVMIAVRDLERATELYAGQLGLLASGGGDHPGRGTRNRIILLDSCYLELIALSADAPGDHWLARFLQQGEGLVRLALGVGALPGTVEGMRARGVPVNGPIPGQLVSPDGASRSWQTAFAGAGEFDEWRWPFLIEHDSAGVERRVRLAHPGTPAEHPLGARDVSEATIAVADLQAGIGAYGRTFGLRAQDAGDDDPLQAHTARLPLEQAALVLAAPQHGEGPISRGLRARGEGLFSITLSVDNLQGAVIALRGRGVGVRVHEPGGVLVAAQLDPSQACGARIKLAVSDQPSAISPRRDVRGT